MIANSLIHKLLGIRALKKDLFTNAIEKIVVVDGFWKKTMGIGCGSSNIHEGSTDMEEHAYHISCWTCGWFYETSSVSLTAVTSVIGGAVVIHLESQPTHEVGVIKKNTS